MSDTNTLRNRIASELNRAPSEAFGNSGETFGTVVNREINSAIAHYEGGHFRWNEAREQEILATSNGTRTYSLPADFLASDTIKLKYNGSYSKVDKKGWGEIDEKDTQISGSGGRPTQYAIYGNILRLFPMPNAAYTVVASYIKRYLPTSVTGSYTAVIPVAGTYSLTVTSTASHNNRLNGWYQDGEQLIRARAVASIDIFYLKKPSAVEEMQGVAVHRESFLSVREMHAYQAILNKAQDALGTGFVRPWCV